MPGPGLYASDHPFNGGPLEGTPETAEVLLTSAPGTWQSCPECPFPYENPLPNQPSGVSFPS